MGSEHALCVLCAWRKDCQKKFLRSQDVTLKCPDYTKDLSIKDGETSHGKATDNRDNKEGV
jgi:hypothetical protein